MRIRIATFLCFLFHLLLIDAIDLDHHPLALLLYRQQMALRNQQRKQQQQHHSHVSPQSVLRPKSQVTGMATQFEFPPVAELSEYDDALGIRNGDDGSTLPSQEPVDEDDGGRGDVKIDPAYLAQFETLLLQALANNITGKSRNGQGVAPDVVYPEAFETTPPPPPPTTTTSQPPTTVASPSSGLMGLLEMLAKNQQQVGMEPIALGKSNSSSIINNPVKQSNPNANFFGMPSQGSPFGGGQGAVNQPQGFAGGQGMPFGFPNQGLPLTSQDIGLRNQGMLPSLGMNQQPSPFYQPQSPQAAPAQAQMPPPQQPLVGNFQPPQQQPQQPQSEVFLPTVLGPPNQNGRQPVRCMNKNYYVDVDKLRDVACCGENAFNMKFQDCLNGELVNLEMVTLPPTPAPPPPYPPEDLGESPTQPNSRVIGCGAKTYNVPQNAVSLSNALFE